MLALHIAKPTSNKERQYWITDLMYLDEYRYLDDEESVMTSLGTAQLGQEVTIPARLQATATISFRLPNMTISEPEGETSE